MNSTPLTRDLVGDPRYLQLALRISSRRVDVMIYNPLEDSSLLLRGYDVSADPAERLKSVESIIYDNPLLLADFGKTRLIVESSHFIVVPDSVTDDDERRGLLKAAHPSLGDRFAVIADPLAAYNAVILTAIPDDEIGFLRRTFNNAPIHNSLAPLARYCAASLANGHTVKAFVNLRPESLDVVIMSHSRLYLVNRFAYRSVSDAVYYLLAATDASLPYDVSEIILTGSRDSREELMSTLRRFRPYVMPMIFPSAMYRAGAQSMAAPFDLVILPLCE